MEFALGILAALIGASGAFTGAWLSGRHERQLEQERWRRSRQDAADDARAAAVGELTKHLASAMQNITWFTAAAGMRAQLFNEQTIIDYDADMRERLAATIESLVAVAHQDDEAFRTLEKLTKEVWKLDWRVASYAARYWTDPEEAATRLVTQSPKRLHWRCHYRTESWTSFTARDEASSRRTVRPRRADQSLRLSPRPSRFPDVRASASKIPVW